MKVLVINCERNGLGVIRSLGKLGVSIIAVDHNRITPSFLSRYTTSSYVVNKVNQTDKMIDALVNIGKLECLNSNQKIMILPTNDIYVMTLRQNWKRLSTYFIAGFELNEGVLNRCVFKDQSAKLAEKANVPIPKTAFKIESEKDVDGFKYPVILKPTNSNTLENKEKSIFRLKICEDVQALLKEVKHLTQLGVSYVAQEYIEGNDDQLYTVGVSSLKGEVLAVFTGRKIRQFPPMFGECSFGESINNEPKLIEYAERLIVESKLTGISQIEFKKKDNEYYLIEINPRSWSWHYLAYFVGVNLPFALYRAILNDPIPRPIQEGYATWHYPLRDFIYNVLLSQNISVIKFFNDFLSATVYAFLSKDDMKPFFISIVKEIRNCIALLLKPIKKTIRVI